MDFLRNKEFELDARSFIVNFGPTIGKFLIWSIQFKL